MSRDTWYPIWEIFRGNLTTVTVVYYIKGEYEGPWRRKLTRISLHFFEFNCNQLFEIFLDGALFISVWRFGNWGIINIFSDACGRRRAFEVIYYYQKEYRPQLGTLWHTRVYGEPLRDDIAKLDTLSSAGKKVYDSWNYTPSHPQLDEFLNKNVIANPRWLKEYIPNLLERRKWTAKARNLEKGDLVLIVDPGYSRGIWPLGRVIRPITGDSGIVRAAEIKTKTGSLVRPVAKIALLEVAARPSEEDVFSPEIEHGASDVPPAR